MKGVDPIRLNSQFDTKFDAKAGGYVNVLGANSTAVTVLPSHEPYFRGAAVPQPDPDKEKRKLPEKYTGTTDSTKDTAGVELFLPITTEPPLRKQPEAKTTVGNLSKEQMTALMAQIGNSENGGSYSKDTNQNSFVGKYQMGYAALIGLGYVKSSVANNAQLNNPNSWTGKDGIDSKTAFLNNGPVQESAMEALLKSNYSRLSQNGTITAADSPETVGGILMVAHLLGPNEGTPERPGAAGWRKGKGGADAKGTTGDIYFQTGKYAVSQLTPKLIALSTG